VIKRKNPAKPDNTHIIGRAFIKDEEAGTPTGCLSKIREVITYVIKQKISAIYKYFSRLDL
jgi:hypothetical protein